MRTFWVNGLVLLITSTFSFSPAASDFVDRPQPTSQERLSPSFAMTNLGSNAFLNLRSVSVSPALNHFPVSSLLIPGCRAPTCTLRQQSSGTHTMPLLRHTKTGFQYSSWQKDTFHAQRRFSSSGGNAVSNAMSMRVDFHCLLFIPHRPFRAFFKRMSTCAFLEIIGLASSEVLQVRRSACPRWLVVV